MKLTREALLAGLGIVAVGLCAPAIAGQSAGQSAAKVIAQVSAAPAAPGAASTPELLSGTPEPTEEPTTPPSDALVAAAAVGPEWNAYAKIVEGADTFIELINSKEERLGVKYSGTVKITSRKPHYARCDIIDGDGKGGVAVWRGGTKVQAHEGGQHSAIIVVLPRHNRRVTDLMGYGCGDTTPDNVVGYTTHNGKLSEAAGPTVAGQETDDVTWIVNPGDQVWVTKEDFFISKTSHLIIETKGYHGDALVEDTTWQITVNPTVPYSTFDIGG
jgi:hypothetical protein